MNENLFSVFRSRFPANLSLPFIIQPNGPTITYGQVIADTGRLANALRRLGVLAGDRVAVQTDKSADALLLYLAAQRLGAVYVPLNHAYTASELRHLLADASPRLFVCAPNRKSELSSLAVDLGIPHVATLSDAGGMTEKAREEETAFNDEPLSRDDLAAILYTSGTTGLSKGAILTHGNLTSNAQTLAKYWEFTATDRLLHALPIFHTHGLFVAVNVALMSGAAIVLLPNFDTEQVLRALPLSTAMMGVPTFYTRLLQRTEFDRRLVVHMRLFISGSAPLAAATHKEFYERTGHEILERYGMTETNMNTSNPYRGRRVPGSVGLALPGVDVRVTDIETARPLRAGEVGQIEICGPNVFKGYWQLPEKTAQDFRTDGFFISGDLGYIDADGYVFIVGRHKDLIISGGFNVYPAEVESVLEEMPGVAQCAVIGVPHPDFGEGVIAIVVKRDGAGLKVDQIQNHLADKLANYKRPKQVFIADQLPVNAMGKVQKKVLRERFTNTFLDA